ncbi:MAG: YcaO-like family protein [Myxococcaceae bacterium]
MATLILERMGSLLVERQSLVRLRPRMKVKIDTLASRVGVSRVARVTGLDRSGVEVACAVRPRGHVLQVCNGKGKDRESARRSAVMEAAELYCAETIDPSTLWWGTLSGWRKQGVAAWGLHELGSAGELIDARFVDARCAWREGENLHTGAPVLIPSVAVHCPPPGTLLLGPAAVRWTSNGMGAHPDRARAVEHALLETIERHSLAKTLANGWGPKVMRARRLAMSSKEVLGEDPNVYVFDVSSELAVPVAAAIVLDVDGPVPLTAGYSAGLTWEDAIDGAVLEAVQSRLTDVHGAREDISRMPAPHVRALTGWLHGLPEGRSRPLCRHVSKPLLKHLRGARACAVELGPSDLGVSVVKVIVPSFAVSGLL